MPNWQRRFRQASVFLSLMAIGVSLLLAWNFSGRINDRANVFLIDCYYYASMAENIREGHGPSVDWPQGPQNKYFPGYAYWMAAFMPGGLHSSEEIHYFRVSQLVVLALTAIVLALLGRVLWRDWAAGLGFAALASSSPILLKWAAVPMSEPLAGLCVAVIVLAAAYLDGRTQGAPRFFRRKEASLALMALAGAAGVMTRVEVGYVLVAVSIYLIRRKRMAWVEALAILVVSTFGVAIWQIWTHWQFHESSFYMREGAEAFSLQRLVSLFVFYMQFFLYVPNVDPNPRINFILDMWYIFFTASGIVALRGYLGRFQAMAAWTLLTYWILHSLWYYMAERYNVIVLPLGYLFLFEAVGRLAHWRRGWASKPGAVMLPLLIALLAPVHWLHTRDVVDSLEASLRKEPFPQDAGRLKQIMAAEKANMPNAVVLADVSIPFSRLLETETWFYSDPYGNHQSMRQRMSAPEAIRQIHATHLALPANQPWLLQNAPELRVELLYSDAVISLYRLQ